MIITVLKDKQRYVLLLIVVIMLLQSFLEIEADNMLLRVAVFCSADNKAPERFKKAAHTLGEQLGSHNFGLITGGSRTGLMKEVVDGYVATAATVKNLYGVLPRAFAKYDVHHLSIAPEHLKWVETLYVRLATFHELADIVVVLPGGFGTVHELMDFLVHNQFSSEKKPIILVNIDNYWDHLLLQFQKMKELQLLAPQHLTTFAVVQSEQECIMMLLAKHSNTREQGLEGRYWER